MRIFKTLLLTVGFLMIITIPSFAGEWKQDSIGYWYQYDDGSYAIGWYQDVDEKWYYFDMNTGYMLADSITPDGFTVDQSGVWIEGGELSTDFIEQSEYDNKIEATIFASNIDRLEYMLPVTIVYNNIYKDESGKTISVKEISISKDGIPYIKYCMDDVGTYYELNLNCKYKLEDGTTINDKRKCVSQICTSLEEMESSFHVGVKEEKHPISAVIYIDMGNTD